MLFQYALKKVRIPNLNPNYWQEATVLCNLNHSNVLAYKTCFRDGDTFCLVMEYCPQGDLRKRIEFQKQQHQKLAENVIVNWIIPLCHALQVRIPAIYYRRRAVVQHCINGDCLSQWRMPKFDPL